VIFGDRLGKSSNNENAVGFAVIFVWGFPVFVKFRGVATDFLRNSVA
jgi:hypothetical protein